MRKALEISGLVLTGAIAYYYGSLASRLVYMMLAFGVIDFLALPHLQYPLLEIYVEKLFGLLVAGGAILLFCKHIKRRTTKTLAVYTGVVFLIYFSPVHFSYTETIRVISPEPSEERENG